MTIDILQKFPFANDSRYSYGTSNYWATHISQICTTLSSWSLVVRCSYIAIVQTSLLCSYGYHKSWITAVPLKIFSLLLKLKLHGTILLWIFYLDKSVIQLALHMRCGYIIHLPDSIDLSIYNDGIVWV